MLNIPAGWKLVPERATQAMEDAWDATPANEDINAEFHAAYAAMLDAAPTPPSVAPGDAQDAVIAGALFDLMGFLTTLDEPVALGSTEEAAIAVELLQRWAAKRGLNLDDADVKGWNERRTAPAAGDARDGLSLFECMTIARRGFEHWAAKPHNRRWFTKIDGTPIPNDLPVCIADEFKEAIDAARAASQQQEG